MLVEGVVTDVWAELQESESAIDAAATPTDKALLHTGGAPQHPVQAPRHAKVETVFFLTARPDTVNF